VKTWGRVFQLRSVTQSGVKKLHPGASHVSDTYVRRDAELRRLSARRV
jgi:hypothetical protein